MYTLLMFGYIATQFIQVSVPGFSSKQVCEQSVLLVQAQLQDKVFPNRAFKNSEQQMFTVCVEVK